MEPRFKKAEDPLKKWKEEIVEKKTNPRSRINLPVKKAKKETIESDCAGVNQKCRDCRSGANIISLEALLKGLQINSHPCNGSACDFCRECES